MLLSLLSTILQSARFNDGRVDIRLMKNIRQQFPEFFRDDYPQFVAFVEAYYEFLASQYPGKVGSVKDIDDTLEVFTEQLRKDLALNIGDFGHLPATEFMRRAKEFYTSRGSESSYRFLFRAMFGKEIEVIYPGEYMLRASDGRWEQDVSIWVGNATGDPTSLFGKEITLLNPTSNNKFKVFVKRAISHGSYYELFIDRFFTGTIIAGDTVTSSDGLTKGVVIERGNNMKIIDGGTGFSPGKYYTVGTTGAKIRVIRVGPNGELQKISIIDFGTDVTSPIYFTLDPAQYVSTGTSSTKYTVTGSTAQLLFGLGAFNKYPGYYSDTKGFLSANIKLQDAYYQMYSYVIRVDEQIGNYRDVVKRLLHPAGMVMYGEYNISDNFDLSVEVENIIKVLHMDLQDSFALSDQANFTTLKPIEDTLSLDDQAIFTVGKYITGDSFGFTESVSVNGLLQGDYADETYFDSVYVGVTTNIVLV